MSKQAKAFVNHLVHLRDTDRGAFAHLRRGLGFSPGAYPGAYPYVERFVGPQKHAEDPWRKALYLVAGLFAVHPMPVDGSSLATALGRAGRLRDSSSIEKRFVALLAAEHESLPILLRQTVSLLVADGIGCDYVGLLEDLSRWFDRGNPEAKDRMRQRWARDFYRAYDAQAASTDDASSVHSESEP